jgi:glycosyltransferase involved in cell wall biosynthesis
LEINDLISVIIPVYNCENYLAEAIESVLEQTYKPVELIVVDDGSTDRTKEVAQRYQENIAYIYQPNSGTSSARNHGVRKSKGSFLAFHDADDIWSKNKLELQMQVFNDEPEVDAVFGHVKQFYSPELDQETRNKINCPGKLQPGYLPYTMLLRRETFTRVGYFETRWEVGGDMNWIIHARESGLKMVMLPDLVYYRRLHTKNKGVRLKNEQKQRLFILKAYLDRQRNSGKDHQ